MRQLCKLIQFHIYKETYEEGVEIISNGDVCDSIIFVINGKIEIEVEQDGDS